MDPIGAARAAALAAQQAAQQAAQKAAEAAAQAAQAAADAASEAPPPPPAPDPPAVQDTFERAGNAAMGAFGKLMGEASRGAQQAYGDAASRLTVRGHADASGLSVEASVRDPFGGSQQAGARIGPDGQERYVASQSPDGQLTARYEESAEGDQSRIGFEGTAPGGVSVELEKTKDHSRGVEKKTYDVDSPNFGFSGGTIKGSKGDLSWIGGGEEGSAGGRGPDDLEGDFYLHVPSPTGGDNLLDVEQRTYVSGEVSAGGITMREGDRATWEGSVDTAVTDKAEGSGGVVAAEDGEED
jgi:hypothetical protein